MKLLLFDVDGTLLIGKGAGARAMITAGKAVCGEAFSLEGCLISGGLDPLIFADAARMMGLSNHEALHDQFRERYLEELPRELGTAIVLPGIEPLLGTLKERDDITLALVTGNYRRAVPLKLSAVGLSHETFVLGAYGDDGPTRPSLVVRALERYRAHTGRDIATEDVIVIGDTPRDVDCALKNGCRAFAVATGNYALDELERAGAHHAVQNLVDPSPLLELL